MINKVTIIGNLGRDPEMKANNTAILSVATKESWKDKTSGEWKSRTEWHKVVAFPPFGEKCVNNLAKGSLVYIEGKLQTNEYEKNGTKQYSTSIIVQNMRKLDPKQSQPKPQPSQPPEMPATQVTNDDIPF